MWGSLCWGLALVLASTLAMQSTLLETWPLVSSQVVCTHLPLLILLLLFPALVGWGPAVFSAYNHWWVVPVIASHGGAVAGTWLYYLAVERHWPPEEKYDSVGTNSQDNTDNNYQQVG